MSLESDITYVYDKVFSKHHNDSVIRKEDYMHLNLSNRQLNILRKMCKNYGIKFENYDYRLPSIEDEELFREYNELRDRIKSNPDSKDNELLEQRRIQIRNKIVTDNLKLVRAIIDRNFDGIKEFPDREYIYQAGYRVLLISVETLDIVRPKVFTTYLSSKLITEIKEELIKLENGMGETTKRALEKIKNAKKIISTTKPSPTSMESSRKSGTEEKRVQELLNLERLLDTISIDEEIENIESREDNDKSPLYNGDFETQLFKSTVRELIIKLLNTLPPQQKDVLMLSYGFKDGRCYNDIEIANIYGITKARIGIVRHKALENLKTSLRAKYLRELSNQNDTYQEQPIEERQLKALEEILIGQIPKEELLRYLTNVHKKERKVLILYYGLEDGTKYSIQSIAQILNLSTSRINELKNNIYKNIRTQISQEISKGDNGLVTYEEYLDYLIKTYIIYENKKRRR